MLNNTFCRNFKNVYRMLQFHIVYKPLIINSLINRTVFIVKMAFTSEVHLRIKENSDKFGMCFFYYEQKLNINKQLFFQRNLSEPLNTLLSRIALKLNSAHEKKKKLKNYDEKECKKLISIQLIKNGLPVPNDVICRDIFQPEENSEMLLKIDNDHYKILINYPWIQNIKLPKSIMAGFAVYPYKLEGFFMNENESEFLWFKKIAKVYDKNPIACGRIYFPSVSDIGCELKLQCTPIRNGIKGLTVETCSTCRVEAGPGYCPFESRHAFTKNSLSRNACVKVYYYNHFFE